MLNVQFVTVTNLVAAEQCAGVILAGHVAVDDVYILVAVQVEPVVVHVYAVVDPYAVEPHITALQNARAMIRAPGQKDVAHQQVFAAVEHAQLRPLGVACRAILPRAGVVAVTREEFITLSVDGATAFHGYVLRFRGIQQDHV